MMKKNRWVFLVVLLFSCLVLILAGCENKNSRAWIENKISAVERVYPTENLYDLFEEFPNGFTVKVSDGYAKDGQYYTRDIVLYGYPKDKSITGKVHLTVGNDTEVATSDLNYSQSDGLQLVNRDVTGDLLPYKTFLFQKLTLNKKTLASYEVISKFYNPSSEQARIEYQMTNRDVNQLLHLGANETVTMEVIANPWFLSGQEYSIPIIYYQDIDQAMHSENIIDHVEEDDE